MKTLSFFCLIFLSLLPGSVICDESKKTNEFVDVQLTLSRKEARPGSTLDLVVKFKPKEGIHINLDPPVSLKFDSSAFLSKVEKLKMPKQNKGEYLDTKKELVQKFSLSKNIKAGEIALKGTLVYFYCSASEGWCSRFKHPFEIKVKVR